MKQVQTFVGIMFFYALLSYVLFPVAFYFLINKSLTMAGNGFIVGSVISILLWFFVGKSLIK
jgi:hypothetical protein